MNRREWLKLSLSSTATLFLGTSAPPLLAKKIAPEGFRTGLEAIDNYAGGWDRKQLISILGYCNAGKTTMAQAIARQNIEDGHRVAVIANDNDKWLGMDNIYYPSLVIYQRFEDYLKNIDCDLLIIDKDLTEFFLLEAIETQKPCWQIDIDFQRKLLGIAIDHKKSILITNNIIKNITYHYHAEMTQFSKIRYHSKVFKISKDFGNSLLMPKLSNDVSVFVTKNRFGPNNICFHYNHVIKNARIEMVPNEKTTTEI